MSSVETKKRPGIVILLAVFAYIMAVLQLLSALMALFLILRPGDVQQLFGSSVSDWYWVTSAILSGLMFVIYVWLARGIMSGQEYGWTLVNLLAILNLFFGLLYLMHGTGVGMILISVLILLLNNTRPVRDWYGTT